MSKSGHAFGRLIGGACIAVVMGVWSPAAYAVSADYTFTNPNSVYPGVDGTGLNGKIWNGPSVQDVNQLSQARNHIALNPVPRATFMPTVVDYPNGSSQNTATTTNFGSALGVDAPMVSDQTLLSEPVLNTIFLLNGYLGISQDSTMLSLGVSSDDGSELLIQGTRVIFNDGIHGTPGPGAGPVDILFEKAGLYEMELLFFESQVVRWGLTFFEGTPSTPVQTAMLYKNLAPVPLPAALPLMAAAIAGLGFAGRLRRKS